MKSFARIALAALMVALVPTLAVASLQAVVGTSSGGGANDEEGLEWLANNLSVTGLTLLATGENSFTSGPVAGDGTLTNSGRSGSWTINNATVTPTYWIVKFDGLVAVYSYSGPNTSPWSDSWDLDTQVFQQTSGNDGTLFVDIVDVDDVVLFPAGPFDGGGPGKPTPNADTSHVSVYGTFTTVVPEPGTIAVWGLLALTGYFGVKKYQAKA